MLFFTIRGLNSKKAVLLVVCPRRQTGHFPFPGRHVRSSEETGLVMPACQVPTHAVPVPPCIWLSAFCNDVATTAVAGSKLAWEKSLAVTNVRTTHHAPESSGQARSDTGPRRGRHAHRHHQTVASCPSLSCGARMQVLALAATACLPIPRTTSSFAVFPKF